MSYPVCKKALGICDRCLFPYKLMELRYETQNIVINCLRVCHTCYDPEQPQLDINLVSTIDPQTLYDARVDTGRADSRELFGFDPVTGTGLIMNGSIGKVTITIG